MKHTRGFLTIPGAIIIAGALVAIALIWIYRPTANQTGAAAANDRMVPPTQPNSTAPAATAADHILGNPSAPIKFIEYSDLSCPFCKQFNPVMVQIMNDYGATGKVAWVYRSLPLLMKPVDSTGAIPHPNSNLQAQALECAAELGGNRAFFAFEEKWFQSFPDDGATRSAAIDRAELDKTAKATGLDASSFSACLGSGKYASRIDKLYDSGLDAGVTGTPTTILFTPSGSRISLVGIQDYATLKTTIDTLITTIATPSIKN
jgi:protein-disulfide isomerase